MIDKLTPLHHSRRSFLRFGTAGLFGLTLPTLLQAETETPSKSGAAKNLILIWLGGGPSTIDMWDPKPNAPEYIRGEFSPIQTSVPGVQVCEHLPQTAAILDRCTLVRSIKHSIPAHGPGSQYVLTGHLPAAATEYPSIGSLATRVLHPRTTIPAFIAFNKPNAGGAGDLGSAWNPFEIEGNGDKLPVGISLAEGTDPAKFEERVALGNRFDRHFDRFDHEPVVNDLQAFRQQAIDVLQGDAIRQALDLSNESEEVKDSYGSRSAVGGNTLRACRLIEAGARFVTVGTTGWDTHANNFTQLRNQLLPQLDRAFSALIKDLESRNLLSSTIVCCCGEFGRTPQVNGRGGRDHWSRAMSVLLAGGGFRSGYVHGATDDQGGEPIEGQCSPADLAATLLDRLGIDVAGNVESFADERLNVTTPSGRTVPVVRDGQVVEQLST